MLLRSLSAFEYSNTLLAPMGIGRINKIRLISITIQEQVEKKDANEEGGSQMKCMPCCRAFTLLQQLHPPPEYLQLLPANMALFLEVL